MTLTKEQAGELQSHITRLVQAELALQKAKDEKAEAERRLTAFTTAAPTK